MAKLEEEGKNTKKEVKLNSAQVDTFYSFIHDLKILKERSGCTTVGYYTVFLNNETIRKTDGSCNWNGFGKLEKYLFGIE